MTTVCPLPAEAFEPGFVAALSADVIADCVRENLSAGAELCSLAPDYVRWKELDGSLVGWRATVRSDGDEIATYVTVRTVPPLRLADEAARLQHRSEEEYAGLRAFALVPERQLLLLSFPLDRALSDLRRLVRASKVRTLLQDHCPLLIGAGLRFSKSRSRCQPVRYKPERRAVLHWDVGMVDADSELRATQGIWLRVYAEATAPRARIACAAAAAASVRCPATLATPHERLRIESDVAGRPWLGDEPADVSAVAATLARLHRGPAPRDLPVHGTLQGLDLALRASEDLQRLLPELGGRAAEVADVLARHVPAAAAPALVHGDFHRRQVLLSGDAGFCDFDRACLGAPALDFAAFRAHEALAGTAAGPAAGRGRGDLATANALEQAYAEHHPLPSPHELAWWNGATMLRVATVPFRRLEADWPNAARRLLALAESATAEVCR